MALRADLIGQRVVVRCVVRGEAGPTGGPAMTDVLGELITWSVDELSVRRQDGNVVVIQQADVVTAKPVPPRGSVRQRVPADDLERICAAGWRAPVEQQLGEWLLRAGGGFTGRANSALVAGDPGLPVDDAIAQVAAFYASHRLPVLAQVVVGSSWLDELVSRGWQRARPDEGDAIVQVASVAQARRVAGPVSGDGQPEVVVREELDDEWIAGYARTADADPAVVRQILESGGQVGFAHVGVPAHGIGRAVVTGDWVGLSAVEVSPSQRRSGIGALIVESLLEWAASQGALSAYLQTLPDNAAALALYARYGFVTHHSYRYLTPPT